jgi:hypothetical protein
MRREGQTEGTFPISQDRVMESKRNGGCNLTAMDKIDWQEEEEGTETDYLMEMGEKKRNERERGRQREREREGGVTREETYAERGEINTEWRGKREREVQRRER